jgi:hypothetical protein
MDLIELTEVFLAAKYHAFSSNTRRAYRYDLMACAQVLATLSIREITVSHLRLFLDATADLAPTTLARRKAALRGVPVANGQCDPFTRNRENTGDAWQSNLTTGDLTLGAIPNPCDGHG